jgi:hypothetical protein
MDAIKSLLGEELFNQVSSKLGENNKLFLHGKDDKVVISNSGEWLPKDKLNEKIEEIKGLKDQLQQTNVDLTSLKKSLNDNEEATTKLTELQNQLSLKEQESANLTKRYALRDALRDSQAKYVDLLEQKFDISKVELDESGKVKGWEDLIKPVKEGYKDLFGEVKREGFTPNPPKPNDTAEYFTMEQIKVMPKPEVYKNIDKVNKSIAHWNTAQ